MKDIKEVFARAIQKNLDRGYKTLYIAVDAHGTIFYPSKCTKMLMGDGAKKPEEVVFSIGTKPDYLFYPNAVECLRMLSKNKNIRLILWTSTFRTYDLIKVLIQSDIEFYYINHNPDFKFNDYADFRNKFYFDVLLDDKAGFDGETDWGEILKVNFDRLNGTPDSPHDFIPKEKEAEKTVKPIDQPPTEKQLSFANAIFRATVVPLPEKLTKESLRQYISANISKFLREKRKRQIDSRSVESPESDIGYDENEAFDQMYAMGLDPYTGGVGE